MTQIDADGPRGFNAWRGLPAVIERRPGTAGPTHRSERKRSSRWPGPAACALGERRPRHSSAPSNDWVGHTSSPNRRMARRNRRAVGAASGRQRGDDGRLRPELTCCLPVVGDRRIADCSAVNLRNRRHSCPCDDLRLSALSAVFLCWWPLCLRVLVFATSATALCPGSVSLCLCGFPGVEIESPRGFLKTHPGRSVAVRPGVAARRPTNSVGLCG